MRCFTFILLGIASLCSTLLMGQSVTIPDTSFARCLRTNYKTIFGTDGKMLVAGANAITGTLSCNTGNIRNAEGLQYFTSITAIHLENNELDTIPNLKTLTKINYLNVSYNNLRFLPGVEKLLLLENLHCYKNKIEQLPGLENCSNLVNFQAHGNNLSKVPALGSKPKLTLLFLNENKIATLTDFSGCPKLTNVRLYQNQLSFKELYKLTARSGYDTLFKLIKPKAASPFYFHVGQRISLKVADTLLLTTGLDRKVPGVRYSWYKNGTFLSRTNRDSLIVANISLSDSGTYSCILTDTAFAGVELLTTDYKVSVQACLEVTKVKVATTDITCLNEGTILVSADADVQRFELQSLITGKKQVSASGLFTHLTETMYQLSLTTTAGCTQAFPSVVPLSKKECEEVLLSPDNDGQGDTYFFKEQGKALIYDKRGNMIRSLTIPGEWDGTSEKGKVFSGFYVADINNGAKLVGITVLY